ncbi:MAG: hypothetical protein K6G07_01190 [Lachnospiraceae bacterium]|nr:hypothetical protein [Lachnospiraceae bacterium]
MHLLGIKSKRCPNGLSVNTVRKHRDYLNLIFEYALKHRDVYGLKENPVKFSTLPKGRKSEAARTPDLSWYNTDNIAIFVDKLIETKEYPFICAVLLALFGGLRRGNM